jgi:hypothetical protein
MNTLLLLPPIPKEEEISTEVSPPLNIVVVFADTLLAKKSAQIYNELIEQFAPDCVFNASWWKFDRLLQRELFEAASHDAAEADIVIVAAHADEDLPEPVKGWMDMALCKAAKQDRLLIALLGAGTGWRSADSAANQYLRTAAQEAGMEYLHRWVALPPQMSNGSLKDIMNRASAITPLLAEILSHTAAVPHGGIND